MTDGSQGSSDGGDPRGDPTEIDRSEAHTSRVVDYLLGGSTNFEVDRAAIEEAAAALGGLERSQADTRANLEFLFRGVSYLTGEAGIRQFMYVGTTIPTLNPVHEVAQAIAPDARVVYLGYDPEVLAHAHSLRKSTPEGAAEYIHAIGRPPPEVMLEAGKTLDFAKPVAVLLLAALGFVGDEDDPYGRVARLLAALAPGSYLLATHLASDIEPEETKEAVRRINEVSREMFVPRNRDEFARFFDGLELVDPGIVRVDQWRPERSVDSGAVPRFHAAVGRKP
jgi:hypothetical protein